MSNDNVIGTSTDGKFRVRLVSDEDCQTPRESDSRSHVVTVEHRNYRDIDTDGGPLGEGWERLNHYGTDHQISIFDRWARIFHGAVTLVDTPQRGPSAVWYVMPGTVKDPAAYLECEARVYRQWADGETYGYIVEKNTEWTRKDGADGAMSTWEEVDSCWGYIGYEDAKEVAEEALKNWSKG